MFKNVRTKLKDEDKQKIVDLLKFKLSKDKKKFIDNESDKNGEYPFDAAATSIDLNGDGIEEVIVNWGNSFTSGVAGSSVTLFIKNGNAYEANLSFGGDIAGIIPSIHFGFPDLSIAARGVEIPVWRYNGHQYDFHESLDAAAYKKLKPVTLKPSGKIPNWC